MYNFNEGVYREKCPYCSTRIATDRIKEGDFQVMQVENEIRTESSFFHYFKCPECLDIFICEWIIMEIGFPMSTEISFYRLHPNSKYTTSFNEIISSISDSFVKIYNEAEISESNNLKNISGPGYRKALEFLIKDYIIYLDIDKKEEVKGKFLGDCISEYIKDDRIKEVAKRAVWIGNDQTHYTQKWEEKNVGDMKEFIDLIIFWIESEEKYKEIMKDMPSGK